MFVPGRIEFLGKHTDYCGGESIVCAIDRGFHAETSEFDSGFVRLTDEDSGESATIEISESVKATAWANYPATVISRLARNFPEVKSRGTAISFRSDLPQAAGLSSSSAFITAVFAALTKCFTLHESEVFRRNIRNREDLAEYLGCIENGSSFRGLAGANGVGTFGGSQDHAAIVGSKKGRLAHFSFSPLTILGEFSFPEDLCFAVATSGVRAEKTGRAMEKYNNLALLTRAIVDVWPEMKGSSLAAIIREHGMERVVDSLRLADRAFNVGDLEKRLQAFYEESFEIIPAVAGKLRRGEFAEIDDLIDRSQKNAEVFLGNQTAETIFLQRTARKLGAVAASAFGAGFGGSVYAIVSKSSAEDFLAEWRQRYVAEFPSLRPTFFVTTPAESRGLPFFREAA